MKNLILALLFSTSLQSFACDMCNMYMSINPNDYKNTISLVHRYRATSGTVTGFTSNGNPLLKHNLQEIPVNTKVQEIFKSYELWARFFIGKKWQLNGALTFADNFYLNDGKVDQNVAGLGDMMIISNYQLYSTIAASDSLKFRQRLLVGGGVKLPTGSYNKTYSNDYELEIMEGRGLNFILVPNSVLDPHIQTGSGSVDFILNTEYMLRYKNSGLSFINTYRINTANKNNFRYANRFNTMLNAFHLFRLGNISLMPHLGLYGEIADTDKLNGEVYEGSGGKAIFNSYGFDVYFKKISATFMYQTPLFEELMGVQVPSHQRLIFGINYLIN
jgi:hypothetical protein